jgi:hypothetical protein
VLQTLGAVNAKVVGSKHAVVTLLLTSKVVLHTSPRRLTAITVQDDDGEEQVMKHCICSCSGSTSLGLNELQPGKGRTKE